MKLEKCKHMEHGRVGTISALSINVNDLSTDPESHKAQLQFSTDNISALTIMFPKIQVKVYILCACIRYVRLFYTPFCNIYFSGTFILHLYANHAKCNVLSHIFHIIDINSEYDDTV